MAKKVKVKIGDKVALSIFTRAVPALIERWKKYCEDNNSDVTFDIWLTDLYTEAKEVK